MPLIVGNLLTDPEAQSFISLEDAVGYLEIEAANALTGTALGDWITKDAAEQESTLALASRWMAFTLPWSCHEFSDDEMVTLGHVAARIAVQARGIDLWQTEAIGKQAKRYKAGSVEVEYQDASRVRGARAGGRLFPWAYPMLRGMLASGAQHKVVRT